MITLHRKKNDKRADEIEQKLKDLVVAYRVEDLDNEQEDLFIKESGKRIKEKQELEEWFRELEGELKWQRSISGDGCYIHPESGKVC